MPVMEALLTLELLSLGKVHSDPEAAPDMVGENRWAVLHAATWPLEGHPAPRTPPHSPSPATSANPTHLIWFPCAPRIPEHAPPATRGHARAGTSGGRDLGRKRGGHFRPGCAQLAETQGDPKKCATRREGRGAAGSCSQLYGGAGEVVRGVDQARWVPRKWWG